MTVRTDLTLARDNELVEAVKRGSDIHFEEIVRRYTKILFAYLHRYTKDSDEVSDILQDTFFKVLRKINSYDPCRDFKPWIYAIARNSALDKYRRNNSQVFSAIENDDSSFEEKYEDENSNMRDALEKDEINNEISKLLNDLKPHYKEVMDLHYGEELTFREIGKKMNRPTNTVKSWHNRAKANIKKGMQAKGQK